MPRNNVMWGKGEVAEKAREVRAKQSWGLFNQLYQGSISVSTPAKSRENKESKIQVNKLIGDLHKQLLQQGKKQSHIGFSFLFLLFELLGPNTPWKCQCYMQEFKKLSFLIPLRKKGTKLLVKSSFLTELKLSRQGCLVDPEANCLSIRGGKNMHKA